MGHIGLGWYMIKETGKFTASTGIPLMKRTCEIAMKTSLSSNIGKLVKNIAIKNSDSLKNIKNVKFKMPTRRKKVDVNGGNWFTLCETDGWVLQKNSLSSMARIIDKDGYQVGLGSFKTMTKELNSYIKLQKKSSIEQ